MTESNRRPQRLPLLFHQGNRSGRFGTARPPRRALIPVGARHLVSAAPRRRDACRCQSSAQPRGRAHAAKCGTGPAWCPSFTGWRMEHVRHRIITRVQLNTLVALGRERPALECRQQGSSPDRGPSPQSRARGRTATALCWACKLAGLQPPPPGVTGKYWRKPADSHEHGIDKNQQLTSTPCSLLFAEIRPNPRAGLPLGLPLGSYPRGPRP